MKYSTYGNSTVFHTAILTGSKEHEYQEVYKHYMEPLDSLEGIIVLTLDTLPKRTPKKIIKECWEEVEDFLKEEGIKTLIVTDTDYFKHIVNQTKVGNTLGIRISVPNFDVFYMPNHKALFYDPDSTQKKIDIALKSIKDHLAGKYVEPGKDIVMSAEYIDGFDNFSLFKAKLQTLHDHPSLTCDIETYSLIFYEAGLGSIAFAWDKHSGMAFYINNSRRCAEELAKFFKEYKGNLIFHNAAFDLTVLIYELYMNKDLGNQKGLLEGLDVFKGTDCTRIMTYLATNSCAGNELGLKVQAQDFAGNYAEDVTDISAIPTRALLEYNLRDCLATWYVWETHLPTIKADKQQDVYNLFINWQTDILQMQLTGMPIDMPAVIKAQEELNQIYEQATKDVMANKHVLDFINIMRGEWVVHKNETLKKKRVTLDDAVDITFNHKSSPQLGRLLYDVIGLPVVDYTKSGEPATGKTTLDKLLKHTEDESVKALINNLILAKDSSKILEAFMPVFRRAPYSAILKSHMLYGNFMLGGTVSGRLSANSPNLQQIPSNGRFAGLIKNCFKAPEGYLFVGLDFDSLEDKINALTTKDENKLKVYLDGFDGHSLRAYAYFGDEMPDIEPNSVESINSISKKYPVLRQDSKAPTFALTYGGTFRTMMKNLGWAEDKSKMVENRYMELYKTSISWVKNKLEEASKNGYITAAFGLRVRTPLLARTLLGMRATPKEAEAEGRTAGNALGQSWCMLNNRAVHEFMEKARTSEYKEDIMICSQIHDASYYLIKADVKILKYINDNLVKASFWQEDPEIQHPIVKLGGSLGIFYPTWNKEHSLPHNASIEELLNLGEKIANE